MTSSRIRLALAALFLWATMMMFGGMVAETVLLYTNIFHDVPTTLRTASEFMAAANPGDYFPTLGMITLVLAALTVVANWRPTASRYWFLGGMLAVGTGDFLLSAVYMWDRNTIMFQEGTAVHSAAYLQQVAHEFQIAHWFRIGASGVAAVLVFLGMLRVHREHQNSSTRLQSLSHPS